jgi:phosphate transport system substrate-binding protein
MRMLSLVLLGALAVAGAAGADEPSPMVDWLVPAVASSQPQTDEEKELGKSRGRALPVPELLQPMLDPALPAYEPRGQKLTGHYVMASSDVLPGLVKAWIAAFNKYQPKVVIELPPPYAGSIGAKELVGQKIDAAFVSRELRPDDIRDFQAKFGYAPLSVPVSGGTYRHYGFLDAVGFIVNKDNPLQAISFEQLDALLSSTRYRGGAAIATWGQLGLGGDWADKPVHVYAIKPWNGFEEFIRQKVLSVEGKRGEWRTDLSFSETVFPMAKSVADDRYGIGYTGLAYIDAGVKTLPLIDGPGAPPVAPSYENVAAARYPLSRLIYFNVNKKPGQALPPALEEFLRFVLSREGQQLIRDQAVFLPLRAEQAEAARALLRP